MSHVRTAGLFGGRRRVSGVSTPPSAAHRVTRSITKFWYPEGGWEAGGRQCDGITLSSKMWWRPAVCISDLPSYMAEIFWVPLRHSVPVTMIERPVFHVFEQFYIDIFWWHVKIDFIYERSFLWHVIRIQRQNFITVTLLLYRTFNFLKKYKAVSLFPSNSNNGIFMRIIYYWNRLAEG